MSKILIKPENEMFDEKNRTIEILEEYNQFLKYLNDEDLKREYISVRGDYLKCPIPFYVSKVERARNAILERGLIIGEMQTDNQSGSQMGE